MTKKIIFGVFAHPDDEAMGPAGALLTETRSGTELHLISATSGDKGTNPDNLSNLGEVRESEWRNAGKLLGATTMHLLGHKDGHLDNIAMQRLTQEVIDIVQDVLSTQPAATEIEFMTLDLNGYTGHIDHIVVARAVCLAFYTLKQQDSRFTRIRFACLPRSLYPEDSIDWIYMEAGHDEVDEIVDARNLAEDIKTIIKAHHSQRNDGTTTIHKQGSNLGLNYFLIKN